jgi:hypothetical protein
MCLYGGVQLEGREGWEWCGRVKGAQNEYFKLKKLIFKAQQSSNYIVIIINVIF